uniref:DNA damage-binding protein 1 n=1 Tax=Nicotiana tabacum TaxID=4097 RepID=A0A1S3XBI5_TOBAC|nr:PREDICTED: DNA damage-binding protein 1-like [Nicotiana tabacum]
MSSAINMYQVHYFVVFVRFEPQALDLKFLYGCQNPTIVVLYQDNNDARYVKTYEVPLEDDRLTERRKFLWALNNLDNGASLLIPVSQPLCGVLIIGEKAIVYCDASAVNDTYPIGRGLHSIRTYGQVDAYRYLLGDRIGRLHLLVITHEKKKVTRVTINHLEETSVASTISYLCDSFVYIGSSYGDSQLVKLNLQHDNGVSSVEVVKSYVNLGPIGDFCVVDLEKQGQSQVVACSGAYKDGSLRIVRSAIGLHEQASAELEGIRGMWSLRSATDDSYDTFLVVSFIRSTRYFKMDSVLEEVDSESVLGETLIEGFNSEDQTLFCHDAVYNQLVQVTPNSVRLVSSTSRDLIDEWFAPDSCSLTVATANATQVLLATSVDLLVCLKIGDGFLEEIKRVKSGYCVSCLDINPIGEKANSSRFAVVGMWQDKSVNIYSLPELDLIKKEKLGGEIIPRSVLMCSFEGKSYLLCGLGDGHLLHFVLNMTTGELTERKKVSLGTQPITLRTFSSKEAIRVFAASDRPVVIWSWNEKLLYSEVNLKDVIHMCPFNVKAFPKGLAITKEGRLAICTIDERQKLHSHSIPLMGEHALRISHQEQSRTFAICSVKYENGDDSGRLVRLLDDQTFKSKSTYSLDQLERGCSILSCSFSDDDNVYYCVGTAYMMPKKNECTKGRILVLQVLREGEVKLVAQEETNGAVYSVNAFNGKLLAAINEDIQLYKWASCEDGEGRKLQPECRHHGRVLALYVQTRGDFIVVGDAMKSISLLIFKEKKGVGVLEERARDCDVKWISAAEILDSETILVATNNLDIVTFKEHVRDCRVVDSDDDMDDEYTLGVTRTLGDDDMDDEFGCTLGVTRTIGVIRMYHLGEFVNRFRHGSLVMQFSDSEKIPTVIFGTANGVIGLIASLPPEKSAILGKLQAILRREIKGVGELSSEKWSWSSEQQNTYDYKSFLDGDLIESFLELSKNQKEEISRELEVKFEELMKTVEELTMLH